MHSSYGLLTSLYAPQCTALPADYFDSLAQTLILKHANWSLSSIIHVTCDTAVIGHAVVKNLLFFTSSTAVCGCFRVSQLHCTLSRSDVTSNEACTLFLHHIYVPAGFCAAGTCGRDNMPDHCDRTQAKQVWSLYDIVAPLQETLNFCCRFFTLVESACPILQCSPWTYAD